MVVIMRMGKNIEKKKGNGENESERGFDARSFSLMAMVMQAMLNHVLLL